ncbi:MAG: hypothetical protein ACK55Z_01415, partial [bacterium]
LFIDTTARSVALKSFFSIHLLILAVDYIIYNKQLLTIYSPPLSPPPPIFRVWEGQQRSDTSSPLLLFPVKTPSSSSTFLKQKFTQRPAVNLLIYIELRSFLLLIRFILLLLLLLL